MCKVDLQMLSVQYIVQTAGELYLWGHLLVSTTYNVVLTMRKAKHGVHLRIHHSHRPCVLDSRNPSRKKKKVKKVEKEKKKNSKAHATSMDANYQVPLAVHQCGDSSVLE